MNFQIVLSIAWIIHGVIARHKQQLATLFHLTMTIDAGIG